MGTDVRAFLCAAPPGVPAPPAPAHQATLPFDAEVRRLATTDAESAAIAETIIALAHVLGMRAVAEGVETAAQTSFLRARNCEEIQDYFVSRPLPEPEWLSWLSAGSVLPH